MPLDIFKKNPKRLTSTIKILRALKQAGHYGLTNVELSHITLSWHRRIGDLRAQGYEIRTERLTKGTFKYFLEQK